MTGIQVYMLRVDGEDRVIAARDACDAIEADFRRFVAEAVGDAIREGASGDYATRAYYNGIFEQVVAVGEIEILTESAAARLRKTQGETP